MKKIAFLMFALVSAVFMFSMQSCSNDESEDPGNYFSYDGQNYPLGSGYNYGYSYSTEGGRVNGVEIMLFSPEFQIKYENGEPVEPDKSNQLWFYINTTEEYKLETGTFTFEGGSHELHAFKRGFIIFNAYLEDEGDEFHEVQSGSVTVKENNGIYEITWDLTDGSGKKITGKYKGEIIDWRTTDFV